MKILHTEASCGWGGQEIRVLSEIEGMRSRGHDMHLVCPASARIFAEARVGDVVIITNGQRINVGDAVAGV